MGRPAATPPPDAEQHPVPTAQYCRRRVWGQCPHSGPLFRSALQARCEGLVGTQSWTWKPRTGASGGTYCMPEKGSNRNVKAAHLCNTYIYLFMLEEWRISQFLKLTVPKDLKNPLSSLQHACIHGLRHATPMAGRRGHPCGAAVPNLSESAKVWAP